VKVSSATVLLGAGLAGVLCAQVAEGIDSVDVIRMTATVEKLDLQKRKATLLLDDGKSKTFKVDKSVKNLDKVKVGDHLKVAYAEEVVITIGKTGGNTGAAGGALVSVAPKGSKPGGVTVETVGMTGKILAVDVKNHKVTVQEPDGKDKTIKVSKKVQNLDQLKAGDMIDVEVTEALAIEVVK
jgi:hypothetical protein